jgi:hypothetical protein
MQGELLSIAPGTGIRQISPSKLELMWGAWKPMIQHILECVFFNKIEEWKKEVEDANRGGRNQSA